MKAGRKVALVSNVPKPEFTAAGLVLPAEADILAGVQADIDAAFGGGVNASLETPQGQLASSESAVIADKNAQLAYVVANLDPDYASGEFQDAIGKYYFLTRKGASPTTVTVTLTGIAGTVVPALSLAQDVNGNTYYNTADVTIGAGGTVTAQFANTVSGPIACAAGSLTQIYQAIPGWDAITNPSAGILGQDVESRADFEYRRKNSVALNGNGSKEAIRGNVFQVSGVTDVYVTENTTSSPLAFGSTSYVLEKNSLYVAVVGGADSDIANAIYTRKNDGSNMNGNVTVIVPDTTYNVPYPTTPITFNRPTALPIKFVVQIVNNPLLPANIVTLIQNAIIARFTGADGSTRERIGSFIFASKYYGAIAGLSPYLSVLTITVQGSGAAGPQVLVGIDQNPTIQASDITVTLV